MKVLITGGTGFIGRNLIRQLMIHGHDVVVLTRNKDQAKSSITLPCEFFESDLQKHPLPIEAVKGVDCVIHLAGESVASKKWTDKQKKKILESRTLTTQNLMQTLTAAGPFGPKTLISASAIGIYGNRADEILSEQSTLGTGFLAEVCKAWENQTVYIGSLGLRIVNLRIGIVLGSSGGALSEMVPLFKAGLGGPLGSGRQYMSWIHIDDLVGLCLWSLSNQNISGPLNAVAPQSVTNNEFSKTLAKVLQKPSLFRVPKAALKIGLGEMSAVVLDGQNVVPTKALNEGYQFQYPELMGALKQIYPAGSDTIFESEQWVPVAVEQVFHFFSKAENLERLTPPWLGFKIISQSTPKVLKGTLIDYKLKIHGVPVKWRTRIEAWNPPESFVDIQLRGPYSKWHHTHSFASLKGGTLMQDRVLYRVPGNVLGSAVLGKWIQKDVQAIFNFRRKTIQDLLTKQSNLS